MGEGGDDCFMAYKRFGGCTPCGVQDKVSGGGLGGRNHRKLTHIFIGKSQDFNEMN